LLFILFSSKEINSSYISQIILCTADVHKIICETFDENVITIRTGVRIGLNDLKTEISIKYNILNIT